MAGTKPSGKGVPVNSHRVLGPVKKDIELPGATKNTTAWGLSKLRVADSIVVVSGRRDAPLGAEPMQFGVERDKNGRR